MVNLTNILTQLKSLKGTKNPIETEPCSNPWSIPKHWW